MRTVLFLCSGNYYRSRFSEIYFNHRSAALGIPWRAESRGFRLHPGNVGPISPHAIAGLQRRALPLPEPLRFPLTAVEGDFLQAAHVVAVKEIEHRPMMRTYFPAREHQIEYWHIDDIDVADPTEALAQLELRLDELLRRFAFPHARNA
jgi:protein-tyrosine phosphatase